MASQAQTTAPLSGVVLDQQTGEPLPGASIEITAKDPGKREIHLLSGLNGSFGLRHIAAGHYTVSVKYVGFERYEVEVDLADGSTKTVQALLAPAHKEMASVNIVGSAAGRGTERSSQLADRRADIIQNSISARAIEVSPDLSVANTAQRVSGVSIERSTNGEGQYVIIRGMDERYIYTLVNGVKIPSPDPKNRYVPLDIFPAEMLERLEIFKSLTPNMEGDAIGGAVNMVMKDAPSKFTVSANVAGSYADKFFTQDYNKFAHTPSLDQSPRILYGPAYEATMTNFPNSAFSHSTSHNPFGTLAGLTLGGRVWGDRLGILVGGSFQNNFRNVNSVFFNTQTSMSDGSSQVTDIQNRLYSVQQQRSGAQAKLDLRIDPKNSIALYGAYFNLIRQEYRFLSDTNLELGRPGPGFGRIDNSYRDLYEKSQISNATLQGKHQLGEHFFIDWTAAYSKAVLNRPDEATLNIQTGVNKDPVTGGKDTVAPILVGGTREFTHSTDEDKSGYLNATYKSRLGDVKVDWSIGGMYRDKDRTAAYDDYQLNPSNPTNQGYDGDVDHNNFVVFNGEGTSDNALNYTASEKEADGYGMVKIDWNKFLVVGGARYQHTQLSWVSNVEETVAGKTGTIKYYDVLPSVDIKYALARKQAIRLSYYSAISRPNFYEVIPHIGGNPDEDYQEMGNPYLKRTTADCYDLRYEYFPKGLDQLLLGVFYKHLKDPIEYSLADEGTNTYYVPENFGNASNYGFELDLTKYWRWFGVRANYTYTNSSITTLKQQNFSVPGKDTSRMVDQTRPLQGQSKHIANLSLLFKDDNRLGLNAQLAFSFTSKRINTVSQFYDNDIWQKDFEQLDLSVEKRIVKHWYVYAKVNNILNTPYQLEILQPYTGAGVEGAVQYQTIGKNTFVRKDTYGTNYLLGVKFKM